MTCVTAAWMEAMGFLHPNGPIGRVLHPKAIGMVEAREPWNGMEWWKLLITTCVTVAWAHAMGFLHPKAIGMVEAREPLEWWQLLITTCVTVAWVHNIDPLPWTTIFTAYFFAVLWLMVVRIGPNRQQQPDTYVTFIILNIGCLPCSFVLIDPAIGLESTLRDGWTLTFWIIISTRFFIEIYEVVRPYLTEELISQEKKKRQRERLWDR